MSRERRIHQPIKAKFNEVLGVVSGTRPTKKVTVIPKNKAKRA